MKSPRTINDYVAVATLTLITLKLTKVIDWSWVWVLAPVWVGIILLIIAITLAITLAYLSVWHLAKLEAKKSPEQQATDKAARVCQEMAYKLRNRDF